jgi:cytochrome c oxidase cbb3-type subunit 3
MRLWFCFFLSAALLAQDPDDLARQQSQTAHINAGKIEFRQTCGFCHGPDGRGASGPDLLHSTLVSHDIDGNLIGQVVRNGRPEKGMPAFQLTPTQIQNIAAFLHSEMHSAESVSQRIPSQYPLAKLLVGNPTEGRAYFRAHCASCHSPEGDLAHIASKYTPFDLQTRIAFPAGTQPQLTVRDHSGHIFTGEQLYADAFYITLKDRNGWQHTWPRNSVEITVRDPLAAHLSLLEQYSSKNLHDLFAYLETLK